MTVPESVIERVREKVARGICASFDDVAADTMVVTAYGLKPAWFCYAEHATAALTALYTALGEEGMVVVPREPTDDMTLRMSLTDLGDGELVDGWAGNKIYRAALSAAPPPPGSTGESLF